MKSEKKNDSSTVNLSSAELKQYMIECENNYRQSVKTSSCSAIMTAYNEWKNAKKAYYSSVDDSVKLTIYKEQENSEEICSFDSIL